MKQCPHCHQPTISGFAKWWSGSSAPATCSACGGLSYVRTSESNGIFVVASLILGATAFTAFLAQAASVLVLGACLAFAYYVWSWRRATLVPTSPENTASAQAFAWVIVGAFVAYVAYKLLFGSH
jgi:hypothetical protein